MPEIRGRARSLESDGCPDATQPRALKAAVQSEACCTRIGRAHDEDDSEVEGGLPGDAPSANGGAGHGPAGSVQDAYPVRAGGARLRARLPGIQADDATHASGN